MNNAKRLESKVADLEYKLRVCKNEFLRDAAAEIHSDCFENNMMSRLSAMAELKTTIRVLKTELAVAKALEGNE